MKKTVLSILSGISIFLAGNVSARTQVPHQEKKTAVQVSFVPPLSTNGVDAARCSNGFSLNLLAGVSKNERAFTLGGLANIIKNTSNGFQLAGLGNYVGNEGRGVLFAGLSNRVKNRYTGVQFAGLANISGDVTGVQFAGLVNIAGNVSGVQFAGLMNVANRSDYPIGLINIIREGEMSVAVSYNEIGTAGITFRSGGKVTYGILGVGYNHKAEGSAFTVLGGFGAHITVTSWFRINNELAGETFGNFYDEITFKVGYALMPAFKIGRHFEVFGGPGLNYMQTDDMDNRKLFPHNSLWKKESSSEHQQIYIGYQAGLQYIF